MKVSSWIYSIICIILLNSTVYAQLPDISIAKKDLLIGEQTQLTIKFNVPNKAKDIVFPTIEQDSINKGLVIIATNKPDTTINDNTYTLEQKYTIALFDTANTFIPPLLFQYNIEDNTQYSFLSDTLFFNVSLLDVNIEGDIKDIKPIWELPFLLSDYYVHIIIGLIVVILLIFLTYYFIKRKRKGLPLFVHKEKVVLSPYAEAIEGLNRIRKEKIWQSGQTKQYYSEMTFVLRNYIERNWNISAVELTSSAIIAELNKVDIQNETTNHLKHILNIADLVKFAKASPLPTENEHCLDLSFQFVEHTKPIEETENQNSTEDTQKKLE